MYQQLMLVEEVSNDNLEKFIFPMNSLSPYIEKIFELLVQPFVQLLFFIAFIIFAWGILMMIANAGNEQKRSEGKQHMMWGIVGMLVMITAYGILALLGNTITGFVGV